MLPLYCAIASDFAFAADRHGDGNRLSRHRSACRLRHRRECGNRSQHRRPLSRGESRSRPSQRALDLATAYALQTHDNAAKAAFPASQQKLLRSEEHTSELQSLMRISYAVYCLKKNI